MKHIQQNNKPLVSIIMPVHNAGRFLVPAIESILGQTYPAIELILVDDGSTDTSWQTIRAYKKKYPTIIKSYHTDKQMNSAGNGATDLGLGHAKGVFIARMDADDISHKTRIEKQVAFLQAHTDVILLGTQAEVINKKGKIIGVKRVPTNHDAIYDQYGIVHPIIHPSIMVRRSMLPNPDKLYQHKWGVNDDYYSFFKLLNYGRFANLPECLLKYRVHGQNASLLNLKQKFMNTVKIRIEAIQHLEYRMSPLNVFLMMIQLIVVSLIPEGLVVPVYLMLRGMSHEWTQRVKQMEKNIARTFFSHSAPKKYYTVK